MATMAVGKAATITIEELTSTIAKTTAASGVTFGELAKSVKKLKKSLKKFDEAISGFPANDLVTCRCGEVMQVYDDSPDIDLYYVCSKCGKSTMPDSSNLKLLVANDQILLLRTTPRLYTNITHDVAKNDGGWEISDFCFGLHHRDDITWLPYSTEDQLIKYFSKVDNVGTWDSHDYEVSF